MSIPPTVTVVTPTRNRPELLERAMASVAAQEGVRATHVVVGDDCPALASGWADRLAAAYPRAVIVNVREDTHPGVPRDYLPARLAYLRNLGFQDSPDDFVAHLDDDNTLRPDHLSSLIRALEEQPGAEVAHSWRRLLRADGSEFVPDGADPWHPEPGPEAVASYQRLSEAGVFVPGSPVVRDTLRANGKIYARVDTSEYLVRRSLHERIPFPTRFNRWQQALGLTEDMAFSHALIRNKVEVVCSRRATLDYYMGGYSNIAALNAVHPERNVAA